MSDGPVWISINNRRSGFTLVTDCQSLAEAIPRAKAAAWDSDVLVTITDEAGRVLRRFNSELLDS
jgi:hypothetical protein